MGKLLLTALSSVICFAAATNINAIPAKRTRIIYRQSDGTTIAVSQRGDEHFHYFVTADDELPVVRTVDGNFYHAHIKDGCITASDVMAHTKEQRNTTEREFIAQRGDITPALYGLHAARHRQKTQTKVTGTQEKQRYEGNKKALVILVNFQDNTFTIDNPQAYYKRLLNEYGFSDNNCHGCVSQYFSDQSNGVFNLSFDVAGPYTLPQDMAYYGGNDANGNDKAPRQMITDACQLAASDIDYSSYDWYDDGNVDMVFVVYAGYNESQGGEANTIWPHQWNLALPLTLNGKKISQYACTGELANNTGTTPDGIGTFCHEFSHCLGLPDFYDTGNNGGFGMSVWSLMDYGSYNGPDGYGECPCNYTSYERWCCGWGELTELNVPTNVDNLAAIDDNGEGYIIYNDGNRNEFYVLDNRQQKGWDTYLPGHGMMVTHVDYNENAWYTNTINTNEDHQRCTIISAINIYKNGTSFRKKDPFPIISMQRTELTNTSHPAATVYNKNTDGTFNMNKPITDIAESEDGLISFKFMGGTTNGIMTVFGNSEVNSSIPQWHNYGTLLPQGMELEQRNGKTIKVIKTK